MKMIPMQKLLRTTAVLIFVVGAGIGYDLGDKQVFINGSVKETFDLWLALFSWFVAFAAGLLFLAAARIIDLLEES